jgi:colanic acid biosynthesis glycosyl transferase WcaI
MKRVAHLGSFGLAAMPTAISVARRFSPDIVFAVAPTLAAANAALLAARITGAASWLHMQDFEVDAAFELGLLKSPNARRFALGAERRVLRSFDRVSSISPAMVERLKQKGVADEQATQLRNWVHIEGTKVFASSNTEYRRELGIRPDDIVALYSGNMAAKQNIESLAEVAARLKAARAPVVVLLCGAGPTRAHLEAACSGLENVRFLPLQPLERLAELLGTADIHLLPQRREAADLVLPSKLTGMLASARPVVAMAEPGTGLAQEVEGCGFVVAAEAEAMSEAVMQLSRNPGLRQELGAAARRRAEQRWSRTAIINSFEREMASLRH